MFEGTEGVDEEDNSEGVDEEDSSEGAGEEGGEERMIWALFFDLPLCTFFLFLGGFGAALWRLFDRVLAPVVSVRLRLRLELQSYDPFSPEEIRSVVFFDGDPQLGILA